ncbi:MAG: phycoerythrobilin:ferredoxin oxidoreductase [Oscillatoriales cyanobacterium SM2_1_8]|nr:phycoerythrobilin:ferredoxin oxidoreductase [Oscillatoriales cyanobacterium SM2_1_8]
MIYTKFLEWAIARLESELGLQPYPIPEGFAQKTATVKRGKETGEVTTTSYGASHGKLRQIRAASVDGGSALQVLNFVISPHWDYDLPFFGGDLVTLPGGHLIAMDLQPLFHDEGYRERYSAPAMAVLARYQEALPWGGDFPEEAKPFFSPAFLWTRPTEVTVVETTVFAAFQEYLQVYIDLVKAATPQPDRRPDILAAQHRYQNYRAAKDPARGMLTRFYGAEWTESYIHEFLFDLARVAPPQ